MKITDETLETLRQKLLEIEPERQHGRKGKELADSEAEKQRLYNNYASRLYRARKRLALKENSIKVQKIVDIDENGITDKDIRRYKNCFPYYNILPEVEYIKRMTGLEEQQIEHLAKKTGLYPAKE